mmetsp:Transcript_44202/g.127704  ORF Transcript_44202/g.127704 Transcript_44202/m.127704 type:complete len:571 (+) Transcript_44202:2-1714(+)
MELARLISPTGDWGKVWLAAHWERKLRRQDYMEADLCRLVEAFHAKREVLRLRAVAHLLLGVVKIFQRKLQYLEEDTEEVKTRLLLVFTRLQNPAPKKAADRKPPGVADGATSAAALLQTWPEVNDVSSTDRLLAAAHDVLSAGKRHVARLEDITLRDRTGGATSLGRDAAVDMDDLFGDFPWSELEAAARHLTGMAAPPAPMGAEGAEDVDFDTQPLVALERLVHKAEVEAAAPSEAGASAAWDFEADTPMPLLLDLDDIGEDAPRGDLFARASSTLSARSAGPPAEPDRLEEPDIGAADEQVSKRRRRTYEFDEQTEIPKEVYNHYLRDRSSITRKHFLDYTVTLPHTSPQLPGYSTALTDLCPALLDTLARGRAAAEKRRRLQDAAREEDAVEMGDWRGACIDDLAAVSSSAAPEQPRHAEGVSVVDAVEAIGNLEAEPRPPRYRSQASARAPVPIQEERAMIEDAPTTIRAVVDQDRLAVARLGYSARTEKMHRFLAREFHDRKAESLSYEALCRQRGSSNRRDIACCFFELLVLQSENVVKLRQERPSADISIEKGWCSAAVADG